MAKKGNSTGVGVGGSSILVIFILLCLTTFATLSMVSANADLRLTEKTASAVREYYDADARAELILADIDSILMQEPITTETAYLAACERDIEAAVDGASVSRDPSGSFSTVRYSVAVSDNQQLSVVLDIFPEDSGPRYALREWAVVVTSDWVPESQGFDLWDGGGFFLGDGTFELE